MNNYYIQFIRDGETEPLVVSYRVGSIAAAFAKCLRKFPGAKLIEGWVKGSYKNEGGFTRYAAPSTARLAAEPAPKEEQTVFGFLEEISKIPNTKNGITMRDVVGPAT